MPKSELEMRAEDTEYMEYHDRYERTKDQLGEEVDWDEFNELWAERKNGSEEMAALIAEVMGIDYEAALAWVEDRDTP